MDLSGEGTVRCRLAMCVAESVSHQIVSLATRNFCCLAVLTETFQENSVGVLYFGIRYEPLVLTFTHQFQLVPCPCLKSVTQCT